jgi:competence protein ComEC
MPTGDAAAPSIAHVPLESGLAERWRGGLGRLGGWVERRLDLEREQLPLWLPVGLGLGVAAWFFLPDRAAWLGFLLLAAGAAAGLAALVPETRFGRAAALFALAAALGCSIAWSRAERVAAPVLAREQLGRFDATVESVQPLAAQGLVRILVAPAPGSGLPPRLRINVDADKAPVGLAPGAALRLRAWLMPPAPPAVPGAYDFARAAWFQGIGGTGRALDVAVIAPPGPQSWRARLADWRQRLSAHIRSRVEGGAGGIAAALATGDQGGIPEEDAEAMRRSGLAHLLSVSGLHLTAVVGAVMLLTLKLLALSPGLALRFRLTVIAAAAGAIAGIAYTLLTGAEVPTIRSCIAAILILFGIAIGREALTLRLVAVGALIVLLLWPESLAGPSFQMSFAAITALVALHEHPGLRARLAAREEGIAQKAGRALLALVLTGLAVEAALIPIALFHFHRAGLYGAGANIIAIPLTTFVVMPLEGLALLFDLAGLGAPFWWLAGKALAFLLGLAHAAAAAPGAVALLPAMPNGAFALMVAGCLWICLWRTRWRRWGALPIAVGALWALAVPPPHLLVTGDGRHVALRTASGGYAILRSRAGDYVRDTLAETAGSDEELSDIEALPGAACSDDSCVAGVTAGGRSWRLLATRSTRMIQTADLAPACAEADIVVSERRLPQGCAPRWLKADRALLARTGGLAIRLGAAPQVETVARATADHPWSQFRALPARTPHGDKSRRSQR